MHAFRNGLGRAASEVILNDLGATAAQRAHFAACVDFISLHHPAVMSGESSVQRLHNIFARRLLLDFRVRPQPAGGRATTTKRNAAARESTMKLYVAAIPPDRFARLFGLSPGVFNLVFDEIKLALLPGPKANDLAVPPFLATLYITCRLRNGEPCTCWIPQCV